MTDRELMQQALEALNDIARQPEGDEQSAQAVAKEAIIALREGLAQPERKPLTDAPTEEMLRAVSEQFEADAAMGIGFNAQTLCRAMLQAAHGIKGDA